MFDTYRQNGMHREIPHLVKLRAAKIPHLVKLRTAKFCIL